MKKAFFSILSVCFSTIYISIFAQNGTIKGVVTDAKTKETIPGVNVVWEKDKTKGASTNLDGQFELKVPAGTQTIVFTNISYTELKKQVAVKDGETVNLNVELSTESKELGTIVYSEGKFAKPLEKVTVSMDVIKPNIIENKNTTSMDQALQQSPGVSIVDNEPQIRGGSGYSFGAGSRVMVMVDDLPLLSGDAGRPSWGFLPVENVEQIEVIKGASSVLYGSAALNGVINIRTAYPREVPQTKINLYTGLYNKPQTTEGYPFGLSRPIYTGLNFLHSRRIGNLDFVVGGNLNYDQGWVGSEPGDVVIDGIPYNKVASNPRIDPNTGTEIADTTLVKCENQYSRRGRINMNLRYRSKKVEGLAYGINWNFMYAHSSGALLWLNDSSGLYRAFPGSVTETKQTTYNIDPFIVYNGKAGARHSFRSRLFHVNNANSGNRANKNDMIYGEYQFMQRFDDYGIKEFSLITGVMATHTVGEASLYEGNESGDGKSNAQNFAAYLQLEKSFLERLTVNAGMRYERFTINGTSEGKPVFRSGFNYTVIKKTQTFVRGSWGQGFRFPTIAEKYIRTQIGPLGIFPNTTLGSETSWNAEIAIKQGVKIGEFMGYIDLAYFHQQYTNNIEFIFGKWGTSGNFIDDLGFRSVNVGPTRSNGVDLSILGGGKIGKVGINTLIGYTYMNPVALDPDFNFDNDTVRKLNYLNTSSDTTNRILKYRFQHLVKADVELTWKKWLLGGSLQYNSFMQNVDLIFETLNLGNVTNFRKNNNKGDYTIDMRFAFEITKTQRISFIINNMLNREWSQRPLVIQPPRTWVMQYTMKF